MDVTAILQAATAAAQALNSLLPLLSSEDRAAVLLLVQQADKLADDAHKRAQEI